MGKCALQLGGLIMCKDKIDFEKAFNRVISCVDLYYLCEDDNLEEWLIDWLDKNDYLTNKYWSIISQCVNLSEGFIEKHIDDVDWECVSRWQNLSIDFIKKHHCRIDFDELWDNPNITQEMRLQLNKKF